MFTLAWSFRFPAVLANFGGCETRGARPEICRRAQTVGAFSPKSAALLGHATRPGEYHMKEKEDGSPITTVGDNERG